MLCDSPGSAASHWSAASPGRGLTLPEQIAVSDYEVDSYVKGLAPKRRSARPLVTSPLRAKSLFVGDRGTLDYGFDSPSLALTPARRHEASPAAAVEGATPVRELPREIENREVELRMLRGELETRSTQANSLRSQVRDAELRLKQAANVVGTLSAKVDATAGGHHAVLEASARQNDEKAGTLRRRLAQMEFELQEKDQELNVLGRAIAAGQQRVDEQSQAMRRYQELEEGYASQAAKFTEQAIWLQRKRNVHDWHDRMHATISRKDQDATMMTERQERVQQIQGLEEDMGTLKAFIGRLEEKCKFHQKESLRIQAHFDTLVQEERVHNTAASLGRDSCREHRKHLVQRAKALEQRIHEEKLRKGEKSEQARAYDKVERKTVRHQAQLAAMVACLQGAARTIQAPSGGRSSTMIAGREEPQWEEANAFPTSPHPMPLHLSPSTMLMAL